MGNNDFQEIWGCADLATEFTYEQIRRRIHHCQDSIYELYSAALETLSGLPRMAMEGEERAVSGTAKTGMTDAETAEFERKHLAIIDRYVPSTLDPYRK